MVTAPPKPEEQVRPVRVQRSRAKGWRMPANTVYVGRPTKWGNPFKVGDRRDDGQAMDVAEIVVAYEEYLLWGGGGDIEKLRGKNLACWCPLDQPCHADHLLELANDQKYQTQEVC